MKVAVSLFDGVSADVNGQLGWADFTYEPLSGSRPLCRCLRASTPLSGHPGLV